ncbi:MAG: prephenate dehydratase [bacterium]|nr:prephenate dehydratase [bacterium]MDT8395724.1 prephenate dehydratase [bacterium]
MSDQLRIAYLGPVATYTHQAARQTFGRGERYLPAESVGDVFSMVQQGFADRGVAPVENSNEGVVTSTLDLLIDSRQFISGEIILPIRHMLLSREPTLDNIRTVYSHPQALAQCRQWLGRNLSEAKLKDARSTAEAATLCAEVPGTAAVAGELTSELYEVPILESDIGDWEENLTRFLIISNGMVPPTGSDKTSVVLSIKDRVGALYEILKPFGENGINLTKIESRPSRKKAWDYVFFVDIEGHINDPMVNATLKEVKVYCEEMKVLGSYPKGTVK